MPLVIRETARSRGALSVPNAITMLGYAATIGWVTGGPPWLAVAGLAADELDGRAARALGQASDLGSALDWAVDLTATGLVMLRLGGAWPWLLLPVTLAQAALRSAGRRPRIGSARAALTLLALARGS